MAVELPGGDSKCEAWPLDHIDDEDDQSSPSPKFLFFLHAVLSRPVAVVDQEEDEEEDQLAVLPENMVDSVNVGRDHVALDYDVIMDEMRSKVAVKDMLSEIGIVPVQDFMVQRILDTALSMSKDKRFVGRKVFRMGVHIDAIVDDLPPLDDDDDDEDMAELDDEYEEDEDMVGLEGEDDWEPKFEPANRVSIEELERVNVGGSSKEEAGCCSVCFDEFETGCEATRMPCSHLFHGDCIVKWLQTSKFCPLCRFQMPS